MDDTNRLGWIVILNGAPRSGKSSIAASMQDLFDEPWMNLGVDVAMQQTPLKYRPGIGLRPGGERQDLEPFVPLFYAALYESIAAHSRLGFCVVADVGHHDAYAMPRRILIDCARRLLGLPALFVGVRCPLDVIMQRRRERQPGREGLYLSGLEEDPVPWPVRAWQREVHRPGLYDLEVDTSVLTPMECAVRIRRALDEGVPVPSAFQRIATS